MKKIVLVLCLVFMMVTGSVFAGMAIDEVMCPCGCQDRKAIDCLCGDAIRELQKQGFTSEDIEEYLKSVKIKI